MSMYEQASKIGIRLENLFGSQPINQYTKEQQEEILNIIIRFGQVAKFRCRSNQAYENFVSATFSKIATIEKIKDEKTEWTLLKAKRR